MSINVHTLSDEELYNIVNNVLYLKNDHDIRNMEYIILHLLNNYVSIEYYKHILDIYYYLKTTMGLDVDLQESWRLLLIYIDKGIENSEGYMGKLSKRVLYECLLCSLDHLSYHTD